MAKTKKKIKVGDIINGIEVVPTIHDARLDAYFNKKAEEAKEMLRKYPIPEEILKRLPPTDFYEKS